MRFDGRSGSWNQAARQPVPAAAPAVAERRSGWLPLAAVRPDYELIPLNGNRLTLGSGGRPAKPAGAICAVSYRAELRPTGREVLGHLFSRDSGVVSRSRIVGSSSVDDFEAAGNTDASWSMDSAVAAAMHLLGEDVSESGTGAAVEAVRVYTTGLGEGEIIVAVDGRPVRTATQLRTELAGRATVRLTVRAPGAQAGTPTRDQPLTRHADGTWGIRVVTVDRVLRHRLPARFELPDDLRGPSLGLACALSIVDACTGGRVATFGTVVATGTVDLTGRVGSVGAIEYKARAVRAYPGTVRFVLPAESIGDVEVARRVLGGRVEIVAVTTLAEAVEILCGPGWRSGKSTHRSADRTVCTAL